MDLFLVRHGETEWNVARKIQGANDSPLTALGRSQAQLLAHTLHEKLIAPPSDSLLLSSPLGRAWETATIIGERLGLSPTHLPLLRERNFGIFEGKSRDEYYAALPDPRTLEWAPQGGESLADSLRQGAAALEVLATHVGRASILIAVSHQNTIKSMLHAAEGRFDLGVTERHQKNVALNHLRFDAGRWQILIENDTSHLGENEE